MEYKENASVNVRLKYALRSAFQHRNTATFVQKSSEQKTAGVYHVVGQSNLYVKKNLERSENLTRFLILSISLNKETRFSINSALIAAYTIGIDTFCIKRSLSLLYLIAYHGSNTVLNPKIENTLFRFVRPKKFRGTLLKTPDFVKGVAIF